MIKNAKTKNILSLIANSLIILGELLSLLNIFGVVSFSSENIFGGFRIEAFKYFTTLSNIFLLITCIVVVIYNIKNLIADSNTYPNLVVGLKFCATVQVSITFLVSALFLAPIAEISGSGYFSMFSGYIFFLHFLCPVLAIISVIFFEPLNDIGFKFNYVSLLPVVVYGIIYFIQVCTGKWSDFYSFTFGGQYQFIPVVSIVMLLITFGISDVEYTLNKRIQKGKRKK